jgi:hypothetical protein
VVNGIQSVQINITMMQRRWATQTLGVVFFFGAIMCILVWVPEWSGWITPLLVVVPGLLAIGVMRFSIISSAYLIQTALVFGVTSLILGSDWEPRLVSVVLTWSLAIAAGTLLGGPSSMRLALPPSRSWFEPRWPHYLLSGGLIAVSAYLALSGTSGYSAQIVNGVSTPTGILGTVTTAAPIVTLTLLLSCIGSGRHSRGAIGLAGAQTLVLALTGFRAAGGVFIVAVLIGAAITLPRDSAWRRKSRLVIVIPVLLIMLLSTFVLGANIKNSAANRLGVSSSGTQLFTLDNALTNTSTRLQLGTYLDVAIEHGDDAGLKEAVSWGPQLQAAVPRFLWRDKPVVDYGNQVSVALYGSPFKRSSTPITTVGDILLNFGPFGVVLMGLFVGYAFRRVAVRVRSSTAGMSVLLCALFSYSAMNQEGAIILILIGILRDGLVAGGLWTAVTLVSNFELAHNSSSMILPNLGSESD